MEANSPHPCLDYVSVNYNVIKTVFFWPLVTGFAIRMVNFEKKARYLASYKILEAFYIGRKMNFFRVLVQFQKIPHP